VYHRYYDDYQHDGNVFGHFIPVHHPTENLESLKFILDTTKGPVENFITAFRILDIPAGRDAGFATLRAKLNEVLFTIKSFIPQTRSILQASGEFGGVLAISDVTKY
jgi:hypothetical protein